MRRTGSVLNLRKIDLPLRPVRATGGWRRISTMDETNKETDKVRRLVKRCGLPKWRHRFGPKTYTLWEHVQSLLLKDLLNLSFRRTRALIGAHSSRRRRCRLLTMSGSSLTLRRHCMISRRWRSSPTSTSGASTRRKSGCTGELQEKTSPAWIRTEFPRSKGRDDWPGLAAMYLDRTSLLPVRRHNGASATSLLSQRITIS